MMRLLELSVLKKITLFGKIFALTGLLFFTGITTVSAAVPDDQLPNGTWAGIRWVHTNVSGWSKSATLKSVSISGGTILFPYNNGNWPTRVVYGAALSGNVWAIIKYNGQWTAFTWDFLRTGQAAKEAAAVAHAAPEAGMRWHPHNGEEIYIFVSGLARTADRNVAARSNVVRYYWNVGVGTPDPPCTAPPTIEYFTGPNTIRKGEKAHLRWKITGASGVGLYASDGTKKEIPTGDLVKGSDKVSPTETTTYTLKATNSCVKNNNHPQKQLTVTVGGAAPWNSILLLKP